MRKMLKRTRLPITTYMRLQRKTGIFPKQFDPECYEILSLNPPLPDQPIPDYKSMKDFEIQLPTDKYVKAYMRRNGLRQQKRRAEMVMDEVDLLGEFVNRSRRVEEDVKDKKLFGPAYDFALRQHEMLSKNPGMSEDESVDLIEKLIEEETRKENFRAKEKRDEMLKKAAEVAADEIADYMAKPTLFFGKAEAAEAMAQFGDYLKQVPYRRWTVGASTALDHWIAIDVLELSEKTWQEILQGESFSQARDVLEVRSALFPETLEVFDDEEEEDGDFIEDDSDELDSEELNKERDATIDELLASLGSKSDDEIGLWDNSDKTKGADSLDDDGYDLDNDEVDKAKLHVMTQEIDIWQKKNMQTPYSAWSDDDKDEFDVRIPLCSFA